MMITAIMNLEFINIETRYQMVEDLGHSAHTGHCFVEVKWEKQRKTSIQTSFSKATNDASTTHKVGQ
jgi:hypothetical protein